MSVQKCTYVIAKHNSSPLPLAPTGAGDERIPALLPSPQSMSRGKVTTEGSGRPNVQKLMEKTASHPEGRLAGYANPFDPNPNPEFGHAIDEKTGMRTGLTPQEYVRLKCLEMEAGKQVAPKRLTDGEKKVIADYVANPPKDLSETQVEELEKFKTL